VLENNLDLKAEEHNVKSTQASYVNSISGLMPSASINGNYSKYSSRLVADGSGVVPSESSTSYSLNVSQPIFNGGKIVLGASMKKDELNIANEQFNDKKLEIIANAEGKFFDYLKSIEYVAIAKKSLDVAKDNLDNANVRFDKGLISKADILRMEAEHANKEIAYIQQDYLNEINRIDFAHYLQIDDDFEAVPVKYEEYSAEIEAIRSMDTDGYESLISKIVDYGLENNSTLKIYEESCDIAKKSLLMAEGNFLPSLNLTYSNQWSKYDIEDKYSDNHTIGLVASIPVFPIVDNISNLKSAHHNKKQTQYNYFSTKNSIDLLLRRSLLTFITAAKSIQSAYISRDLAEETYMSVAERFKANLVSSTEILDAELLLESSQLQFVTVFYDYLKSKSQLKRYLGIVDESKLNSLILY